jgi:hypothetical protein
MNVNELYEHRKDYYLTPSPTVRGCMVGCLILGLVTLAYAFSTGHGEKFWGAFLFNLFFFFSLSLGGMAFAAMQDVIGAVWGRPIKRLHEAMGAFIPVCAVLFVIMLLAIANDWGGARGLYSWIADPSIVEHFWGKVTWLQEKPMMIRAVVMLAIICGLVFWQLKQALGRDVALINGDTAKAKELGESSVGKMRYWSGGILIAYGILFTFLGFDLIMSMSPLWFSTLFGGWQFSIMMQTLMAAMLLIMFSLRSTNIGQLIGRQQFHDIGKLMHGFTIFFAYLTYAHILTYWYGNMPEETEYFIHRLHGPWLWFVLVIPLTAFVLPLYAMIFKASKWTSWIAIPLSVIILVSQWATYLLLVMPDVVDAEAWGGPFIEIGIFAGFLGLFMLTYFWFGKRYPMVGIADPLLPYALENEH